MQEEKRNKSWEILKNSTDLEYKRLLQEYSAILIALYSMTIGILGFTYKLTGDITLTTIAGGISYLILNTLRKTKKDELDKKVNKLKSLVK